MCFCAVSTHGHVCIMLYRDILGGTLPFDCTQAPWCHQNSSLPNLPPPDLCWEQISSPIFIHGQFVLKFNSHFEMLFFHPRSSYSYSLTDCGNKLPVPFSLTPICTLTQILWIFFSWNCKIYLYTVPCQYIFWLFSCTNSVSYSVSYTSFHSYNNK